MPVLAAAKQADSAGFRYIPAKPSTSAAATARTVAGVNYRANQAQKPKNHRQGIAGGFGGLHLKFACLLEDMAGKGFVGCAIGSYLTLKLDYNS